LRWRWDVEEKLRTAGRRRLRVVAGRASRRQDGIMAGYRKVGEVQIMMQGRSWSTFFPE